MAMKQNVSIRQANTYELKVAVLDNNGNPANITGFHVWFTVKKNEKAPDSEAIIYVEQLPDQLTNPTEGYTIIRLGGSTGSEGTDKPVGKYKYDIQILTDTNEIYTLFIGDLYIEPRITKDKS